MDSLFTSRSKYQVVRTDEESPKLGRPPSRFHSMIGKLLWTFLGIAIGLTLGLTVKRNDAVSTYWVAPLSPIPTAVLGPRISKVFNPDERYIGPSEEVDQNWLNVVDSDAIYISNPQAHGLATGMQPPPQSLQPPSNITPPSNFYFVSNLHQFHCLNIVRRRYWSLINHGYDPSDPENEDWRIHVDHCIEYLRLGITCGDLLVVEPDSPPGTPVELTVDGLGWGVTHECINFEKLLVWQKEQELLYVESWQNRG